VGGGGGEGHKFSLRNKKACSMQGCQVNGEEERGRTKKNMGPSKSE